MSVTALAFALISTPPVSASAKPFEINVVHVGQQQILFGICLNDVDLLPARLEGSYTVLYKGSTIESYDWTPDNPDVTLLGAAPCPESLQVFSVQGLSPGTSYTINAAMTIIPRIETGGWYLNDPSRPPVDATDSMVVATADVPTPTPSPGGGGGGGGGATPEPSATPRPTSSPIPTAEPEPTSGPTPSVVSLVIEHPRAFTTKQLSMLSPALVATIAPASFANLRPSVLRTVTSRQAAAITPAMLRSLGVTALRALTPAAIHSLSPSAVRAMRLAQLSHLTPSQVAALTPSQLAGLTPAQRKALYLAR